MNQTTGIAEDMERQLEATEKIITILL